jgi:serine phosphatase RsbU (regulator of sigma subunit)
MHHIPKLMDIAQPVASVDASTPIISVMDLFAEKPELMALPVTEKGVMAGIVRKGHLFKVLSRAFALEVYSRRPIGSLLDEHSVLLDPGMDIHSALASLLKADPALETDVIALVSENTCQGIIPVSALLMSISESQTKLFNTLNNLTLRMRDEVQKAAQIQQALLPSRTFKFPGIGLAAELKTCTEIGGDFFDYFAIDRERLCLFIADVSGHGVQAGMVTTAAKASLHTLARNGITTPSLLLSNMNEAIRATAKQALLMTCFVAIINLKEKIIWYANAGHNYPYICRKHPQSVEMLTSPDCFPLGFDEKAVFKEQTASFVQGDTVVLYSDGINECSDGNEDFGYARFEDCLRNLAEQPLEEWVRRVLDSLSRFRGHEQFDDDVTLVAVRYEDPIKQSSEELTTPISMASRENCS